MGYKALYRTYRPMRFSDVVGQEHVVVTLKNSIKQGKTGHAYLFSGPRGTGKTTIARILARAINCGSPKDGEPCGECQRCAQHSEGVGVLEIDGATHASVEDMRTLVAQVAQVPLSGGMNVYIIDEVHMLSTQAFNAFLKTLEEPPPHAVFVLATTEPGKLLPTIHSRCQHFAFHRISLNRLIEHIGSICEKENIPADTNALRLIARAGDGSVRDSMSILEQAIAYEPKGLTLAGVRNILGIPDRLEIRQLADLILENNASELSVLFNALIEQGREPKNIIDELIGHFRELMLVASGVKSADVDLLPEEEREVLFTQAKKTSTDQIFLAITAIAKLESEIKYEDEASLLLEVSLIRLGARLTKKITEEPTPVPMTKVLPPSVRKEDSPEPRKSPLGLPEGKTLKKTQPLPDPVKREEPKEEKVKKEIKSQRWVNGLGSVKEISVADYVILMESEPDPIPEEWKDNETSKLDLVLKYEADSALVVHCLKQPELLKRIENRLSEVFERKISISSHVNLPDDQKKTEMKTSGIGGESPVLFSGAGRPAPSDPVQRQIHDLIARDFPEYNIEFDTGTQ